MYATGAGIILAGIGVAIYFASKEEDPIIREINQLGKAKLIKAKTQDGRDVKIFQFEYFNALMRIIKTNLLNLEAESKGEYVQKRLALYKE